MDELILYSYTVICRVPDCENFEIPIVVNTDATAFLCGPCGTLIEDVTKITE
jgi:hypothetical protein